MYRKWSSTNGILLCMYLFEVGFRRLTLATFSFNLFRFGERAGVPISYNYGDVKGDKTLLYCTS